MDFYYNIAEQEKPLHGFKKGRYYNLKEIADQLQIEKRKRHLYLMILQAKGLIHHNHRPTELAQLCGLFQRVNPFEHENACATYVGALVITDLVEGLSQLNRPKGFDIMFHHFYHSDNTREFMTKVRQKRNPQW